MPTITESGAPGDRTASRAVVGIIAVVAGAIALAIAGMLILLVQRAGIRFEPMFGVILSLAGSFTVFFAVVAIQGVTFVLKPRGELMSLASWGVLAATLVLIGVACAIVFHWVAVLFPLAMALSCSLKEPRVQTWIRTLARMANVRSYAVFLIGALLYLALVMGSMRVNFVPSGVQGWMVVLASSALGIGLPFAIARQRTSRQRLSRPSASNQRWFYFYMWLFGFIVWVPVVGLVLPVAISYVYATPIERELTVSEKRSPTRRRSCNGLALQEYQQLLFSTVCVSPTLWESLSPGAKINAKGVENWLGFRVQEVNAR